MELFAHSAMYSPEREVKAAWVESFVYVIDLREVSCWYAHETLTD